MDNRLQATFMPRQAPGAGDAYVRPKGPPNFLMGIAIVLLILAGGAWAGLFFYKGYIIKSNEAKKEQIQQEINNFDPELTKQLTVLKARIDAGKALLAGHVAVSEFLSLLSANTVQSIQFNTLSLETVEGGDINLNLKGQATSYNAIAFQSDVFSKVPQIITPVFDGLSLNDKGIISFGVTAKLDKSIVSYADLFKNETVAPVVPPVTTPVPTSTPATTSPRL